MIKVCIVGATGKVGGGVAAAVTKSEDLVLVGAVARRGVGKTLAEIRPEIKSNVVVNSTLAEALMNRPDVVVEYTNPLSVKENVFSALEAGIPVVVGTSGLTKEDYEEIDALAQKKSVGVFAAGNFSLTAVLLQVFAEKAARHLKEWEIIDYSAAGKQDAPSGTCRELVSRLAAQSQPEVIYPIEKTIGEKEARGVTLEGMQVHSVRLSGYTSAIEITFGRAGERLLIRHDSTDETKPYVAGTLMAVRRISEFRGLVRGLDKILEI